NGQRNTIRQGLRILSVYRLFQSPLHRGRVFNVAAALGSHCQRALSVPSSSGKGLQLVIHLASQESLGIAFSPLFIGEGSSTITQRCRRGTISSSFSPLFIGEGSSTPKPVAISTMMLLLSVPSSSGKGLQQ